MKFQDLMMNADGALVFPFKKKMTDDLQEVFS